MSQPPIEWLDTVNPRPAADGLPVAAGDHRRAVDELRAQIATLAHDLGAPLRAIRGFSQILDLRAGPALDPADRDLLDLIGGAARDMQAQLDAISALSRLATAALVPQPCPVDDLVAGARARLAELASETGAALTLDDLPGVQGDRAQLEEVFEALLANAMLYGVPGVPPAIKVSARAAEGGWVVSVCDNGIGLDPAHRQRAFEIFWRANPARHPGRAGIGLTRARCIVERHGGRIGVSGPPAAGLCLHVFLPAS